MVRKWQNGCWRETWKLKTVVIELLICIRILLGKKEKKRTWTIVLASYLYISRSNHCIILIGPIFFVQQLIKLNPEPYPILLVYQGLHGHIWHVSVPPSQTLFPRFILPSLAFLLLCHIISVSLFNSRLMMVLARSVFLDLVY